MDFWQTQKRARQVTTLYLLLFLFLTAVAALLVEFGMRYVAQEQYDPPMPLAGCVFLGMTFLISLAQYSCFKVSGGKFVAESMGAMKVDPEADFAQKQLANIVEEIAIASALPVPALYILDANEINAFAAGLAPDSAVIAVTKGALEKLSRDELQGVIAHEFGHIQNGDMLIGLRLAAMIMGFYFIFFMGLRMMQMTPRFGRRSNGRGANPIVVLALFLFLAGAFTWFFGSILKAMVSRQREYLADASSVQYTRNPEGLANALRKIAHESAHDMPKSGMAYSHLYFNVSSSFMSLFATHPPLQERIERITGKKK